MAAWNKRGREFAEEADGKEFTFYFISNNIFFYL